MLSATAIGLIIAWVLAIVFSVTLGGWIHLLPVVAVPLFLARFLRRDKPSDDYRRWEHAVARRRR